MLPAWSKHTKAVVKRARQNLIPLKRLKRLGMGRQILKKFYSCIIESWLYHCLVWQLLSLQPQGTTEGSAYGPVHHGRQTDHQVVSGPKNGQRLQPP